MCPFDALGSAVSVFCGQNLGAKKPERIRQGVRLGVIVGVAYGFCIGLVMIFFGRSMSMLFVESSAGDVLDASAKYLRCMGYFFWSLGILNICRMATQGIGFSGRAVFSGVTEMFARSIVSLGFVGAFGYTAIWIKPHGSPPCSTSPPPACTALRKSQSRSKRKKRTPISPKALVKSF